MNKTILAIDTATESISVALFASGAITELKETHRNEHTEKALPMIDTLLKRSGLAPSDLDAVAFGSGPGAFTGLRVACGIAQGLGWALDIPLVAVSNLEALALKAGQDGRVIASLDARMGECYAAVYALEAGSIVSTLEEATLLKPESLFELAQHHAVTLALGSAFAVYQQARLPASMRVLDIAHADARDIVMLAATMLEAGRTTSAALATPLYVRNRVALTIKERGEGERL